MDLAEKLIAQNPSATEDLIFMGSSPLGGAANTLLELILQLKGGRLILTAGDSVYAFVSYLVYAEDKKSADVLAEAVREIDKAAEADAKACHAQRMQICSWPSRTWIRRSARAELQLSTGKYMRQCQVFACPSRAQLGQGESN